MKKFLLLLPCLLATLLVSAQIPGAPPSVPSPTAANLGLYGEVPVSLFSGLPSIEIPLYTLEEGPIKLPISLSYHASGFRPDMHPGWVGMGWSLNAGGVINRSVNDAPDDYNNASNNNQSYLGYYWNRVVLNRSDWASPTVLQNTAVNSLRDQYSIGDGGGDTEPDEFSFSFNGYSGKFYLHANGTWMVKCNKPITVTPTVPGNASSFQNAPIPYTQYSRFYNYGASQTFVGFTITTEDGTQYVFGGPTNAIEYQLGIFREYDEEWVATSWYLTQIIHNDGHQITLNYARDANDFVAQMYTSLQNLISIQTVSPTGFNPGPNCNTSQVAQLGVPSSGKLISPVYLDNIQTSQNAVYFDRIASTELTYRQSIFNIQSSRPEFPYIPQNNPANLKWKELTAIRISTIPSNQVLKSFSFAYNNNQQERLTLLAVTEQGPNNIAKPPYKFGYNKYHSLPDYLSGKSDHWGFYNANSRYGNNDYSYVTLDYNTYYADRNPNPDSAVYLAGMLTRMVYPTGGVTDFLYEQHTFGKQLQEDRFQPLDITNGNQVAGGVRIKKITSYSVDNPQQKLEKEYLYGSGYSPGVTTPLASSGILGGRARYQFDDFRSIPATDQSTIYSRSIFSVQSVLPACINSQGNHIGYSTVVEKRGDGSYTQYQYSNFDTGNMDEPALAILQADAQKSRTIYSPFAILDEDRGQLLREDMFTNTGLNVKQRLINYVAFNKGIEFVPSMQASSDKVCSDSYVTVEQGAAYKIYTYSSLPTKVTETVFDINGANGITTVKNILYNSHRLIQSENTTDSKGINLETQYKYCFDFPYNGPAPSIPLTKGIVSMAGNKNMVGYPIQTLNLRDGKITRATVALYSEFLPGQILPSQILEFTPTSPLDFGQYQQPYFSGSSSSSNQQFLTDARLLPKLTFNSYDEKGNLLGLAKEGNQLSCYQWGYSKTLPIAKTDNALPSEVFSSNFEEDKMVSSASADIAGTWFSPGGYLKFEATPSDPNHPSTRKAAHTGQLAGAMYTTYLGEQAQAFSPTLHLPVRTTSKRYVLSGWVYTNGPAASIWLFPNLSSAQNSDGTFNYYDGYNNSARPDLAPAFVSTEIDKKPDQLGRWVYLEKEVAVPADATLLTFRLSNFWNSAGNNAAAANGGGVWFDDVRIHPADAQMTTYTHQPGVGVTSISDANNKPAIMEYDPLTRLTIVRDQDGNIVKQYQYHYKNQ